jgi:hypothetical protein
LQGDKSDFSDKAKQPGVAASKSRTTFYCRVGSTALPFAKQMSIKKLRSSFGGNCHWCGLPMDFGEPRSKPESATIEHLHDATFGGVRQQKHRRLSHAICNRMRNEFKLQAERDFRLWIAERMGVAAGSGAAHEGKGPAGS